MVTEHDGFESPRNWHDILSFERAAAHGGGARRAGEARLMRSLDQLDSALSEAEQRRVLELWRTVESPAFRSATAAQSRHLHDASLELREDGSWKWTDLR